MIYEIILLGVMAIVFAMCAYDAVQQKKALHRLTKVALKVAELEEQIKAVDYTTGVAIHNSDLKIKGIHDELKQFKTDYGEAAIDELRQRERKEKAWADGIDSIMSYGTHFQGGGNGT